MADGLKGRGIHLYPETSPTRYGDMHGLNIKLTGTVFWQPLARLKQSAGYF